MVDLAIPPPRDPCLEVFVSVNESPPPPVSSFSEPSCKRQLVENAWTEGFALMNEMKSLIEDNNRFAKCLQSLSARQDGFMSSFLAQRGSDKPTRVHTPPSLSHVVVSGESAAAPDLPSPFVIDKSNYTHNHTPSPASSPGRIIYGASDTGMKSEQSAVNEQPKNGATSPFKKTDSAGLSSLRSTILGWEAEQIAGRSFIRMPGQDSSSLRWRLRYFLESYQFESFIGFMILANSVLIGVEVEYVINARENSTPPAFRLASYVFTFFFFGECVARCVANCGHNYFKEKHVYWNLLDAVVVLCSMIETTLDFFSLESSHGSYLKRLTNLRILRILRIVRMAKILSISRVLRLFKALRALIYSIVSTLRTLFWAMVLLSVIMYCFAIVFTQSAADYLIQANLDGSSLEDGGAYAADVERFWGSLLISMRTLFQSIAGGVSWIEPLDVLDKIQDPFVSNALFGLFIAFTYFAVLNVVTGTFCSAAMESASRDNEQMISNMLQNRKYYCDHLATLFKSIDLDESGQISLAEFEERFKDLEVQAYFASLELNAHDAMEFFRLLDTEDAGFLDLEDFVDGCLRMRGPARSVDMLRIMHEQRKIMKRLKRLNVGYGLGDAMHVTPTFMSQLSPRSSMHSPRFHRNNTSHIRP